jgi:hypothetical protein
MVTVKKTLGRKNPEKKEREFYMKYRWFFTKSSKLVYGGKSAEQNEEIVNKLLKEETNCMVMHTKMPGSPFSIIFSEPSKVSEEDMEEAAAWTGCFSRAWRSGAKKAEIDMFLSEQIFKDKRMKDGTFGVRGIIDRKPVDLRLYLVKQKGVLRCVPRESLKISTKVYTKFVPGNIPKEKFSEYLVKKYGFNKEEVLNALPSGGFMEFNSASK